MTRAANITRRTAITMAMAAPFCQVDAPTGPDLDEALSLVAHAMKQICQDDSWRISIGRCWQDGKQSHYYHAVRIHVEMAEATTSTGQVSHFAVERHETLGRGGL